MQTNDARAQAAIAELMRTPVGRRWLLKAGFSAVAAGAMLPGMTGCGDSSSGSGTVASGDFHFALPPAARLDGLTVVVNGQRVALQPHTPRTRSSLQALGTLWATVDTTPLPHFATLPLPANRAMPISSWSRREMGEMGT